MNFAIGLPKPLASASMVMARCPIRRRRTQPSSSRECIATGFPIDFQTRRNASSLAAFLLDSFSYEPLFSPLSFCRYRSLTHRDLTPILTTTARRCAACRAGEIGGDQQNEVEATSNENR